MGILTEEGIAVITDIFNAADVDKSGTVDAGELETVLAKVAEAEGFEPPSKEKIQTRLDALPTENEGALTLPELLFLIGSMKVMAICLMLFTAADTDGSGVLESEEIKKVILNLYEKAEVEPPSDENMDKDIAEMGGKIEFDQFAALMIPVILAAAGDPVIG